MASFGEISSCPAGNCLADEPDSTADVELHSPSLNMTSLTAADSPLLVKMAKPKPPSDFEQQIDAQLEQQFAAAKASLKPSAAEAAQGTSPPSSWDVVKVGL